MIDQLNIETIALRATYRKFTGVNVHGQAS